MDRLVRFARTLGGLMLAGKFRTVNEGRGVRGGLGNGSGSMRAAAVRTARMLGCRSLSMVVIGAAPAGRLSRPRLVRRAVGAAENGGAKIDHRIGGMKPPAGGGKPDRSSGPPSIPSVFCGTREGCIEWSSMRMCGVVSMWKG